MTVTPVGLNQQVYMGNQNGTVQPVQQNAPISQPIPVGQPVPQGQQVPQTYPVQYPQGYPVQGNGTYPVAYPNNSVLEKLPQSNNTYDNDIMMNGIDFDKLAQELYPVPADQQVQQQPQQSVPQQGQVVQQQVSQTQPAPTFTGNPFAAKPQDDGLTNYLVTPEEKEKNGAEEKFKLGPAIGATVGFAAPFVCNKARLGKFLTKDLLVKAPVISAGGLCAGGMAEGLVASAKKLEANNAETEELASVKMDAKA